MRKFILSSILIVLFITGCGHKAPPIHIPDKNEISSVTIRDKNDSPTEYSDADWISNFIDSLKKAQPTGIPSVSEAPTAENAIQISFNPQNPNTTLFYYTENGKNYLEQPYQGVYRITEPIPGINE